MTDDFETAGTRPLPESGTGSATRPVTTPTSTPTTAQTTTMPAAQDDVRPGAEAGSAAGAMFPEPRPVRMRTVVVGIVLLAIAVLTNLKLTTSVEFRLGTVVLALMIGCGVLLIVGASRRE